MAATASESSDILAVAKARVAHFQKEYSLNEGKAFMMWHAMEAFNMGEGDAYEAVAYDRGNDKKIDFFHVDDEVEKVLIAQGKFSGNGRVKATPGEFFELVHAIDWLQDPAALEREGRPDLANAGHEYLAAVEKGYSVEFAYVFMGPHQKAVIDAANQFNVSGAATVPSQSARIVDLALIQRIHEECIDSSRRIDTATLSVTPDTTFTQDGAYGRALVTTLSGTTLRELYKKHGDSLFDRNVRLFLGAHKGSVNAGILDTLSADSSRRKFWAYNNGLTFVCDSFDYDAKAGKVTLKGFSIVNGCQTTVSIGSAKATGAGDVAVLGRIIACGTESTVNEIITFTNRQTPINPWDISSQDKIQKRLKRDFESASPPFFYAVRPGETRPVGQAERRKFTRDGRLHVIHLDRLAQCLGAFAGIPMVAYKEKGRLFSTARDKVFPSDITATNALLAWIAGQVAEETVLKRISEANASKDEDTVRILKRGGKLFVLSMMSLIMIERNGATYLGNLKWANVVSRKGRGRLAQYAAVALEWYVQAMKEFVAGGSEVTTVLRSQVDWYPRLRDKVLASWRVQKLAQGWVDAALPKL